MWRVTGLLQLAQARLPCGGTISEEMMNIANMVGRYAALLHHLLMLVLVVFTFDDRDFVSIIVTLDL